jgi:hypothetical protein
MFLLGVVLNLVQDKFILSFQQIGIGVQCGCGYKALHISMPINIYLRDEIPSVWSLNRYSPTSSATGSGWGSVYSKSCANNDVKKTSTYIHEPSEIRTHEYKEWSRSRFVFLQQGLAV